MDTAIDIDPDGNSIATQREFGQRRADTLNAMVDKVFIEPGNSAQSIEKRPVFREVLAYLREHPRNRLRDHLHALAGVPQLHRRRTDQAAAGQDGRQARLG
jgi:hypothetical protein